MKDILLVAVLLATAWGLGIVFCYSVISTFRWARRTSLKKKREAWRSDRREKKIQEREAAVEKLREYVRKKMDLREWTPGSYVIPFVFDDPKSDCSSKPNGN